MSDPTSPPLPLNERTSGWVGSPKSRAGVSVPPELVMARRECRRIARQSYENFVVASVLLPLGIRQPFYDLYAFCRTADDLADESSSPEQAHAGLSDYRRRIERLFSGGPNDGIFLALAETVRNFSLPREPFDDLLSAFEQDQIQFRYHDESDLLRYCERSANPVGRMVLGLASVESTDALALSDQICTGLQLANFWQDVARDFRLGRIYLPESVMQRHGFDENLIEETKRDARPTPQVIRAAIASQCDDARVRLSQGVRLAELVPGWLSSDIKLFAHGGLATLDAIERIDFDVLTTRPTVSKRRQVWLVAKAWLGRLS